MPTTPPKVFISYAHEDGAKSGANNEGEQHPQPVLAFANQLRSDGVDIVLDLYFSDPPEGWPMWMNNELEAADMVLLIITETYSKRIQGKEKQGVGKGSKFAGTLVYNAIHDNDCRNSKFVCVLFQQDNAKYIPLLLKGNSHYLVNDKTSYQVLLERIYNQHQAHLPALGAAPSFEQQPPPDFFDSVADPAAGIQTSSTAVSQVVKTSHLPSSNYDVLVGRDSELQLLDNAWNDPHTRIIALFAWGGVGKTALVHEWLERMNQQGYRGASHVLGYSFYSQGSDDDRQVSSDVFFTEMFRWLRYGGEIPSNEHTKGEVLAELIAVQKVLLVLDGLEPLQWPSASPQEIVGQLKDPAIKALLRNLADKNPGLVVISSRLTLTDLSTKQAVHSEALQRLSLTAGMALLERAGVTGPTQDKQDAVNSLEGHALSLNLLASYLVTVHQGDVRRRDLIASLRNARARGAKANRMLDTYVNWLTSSDAQDDSINAIALNYLHLLGLFDQPVTPALQMALLAGTSAGANDKETIEHSLRESHPESITGVTDHLISASHEQKQLALELLRQLKLLNPPLEDKQALTNTISTLDCHPLIRDYFANRLQTQHPDQYIAAHTRLYHYYKSLPEEELPDTLAAMQPLLAAVAHGCKAGLQQQAMDEVRWPRIDRKEEDYIGSKLGAFAADLACIAQFFQQTWQTPSPNLSEDWQSAVLNWAAFRLRGLSRLAEAVQPFEAGLRLSLQQNNFQDAAINASNLSQLHLSLGNIEQALAVGEQAVYLADNSDDKFRQMFVRTTYAAALYHHGQWQAALELLTDAEQRQQQRQAQYKYLYSLQGFRYCSLLLALGDWQAVITRAETLLNYRVAGDSLLDISLEELTHGNAYLQQAQSQNYQPAPSAVLATAKGYLDKAVTSLRQAGTNHHLPRGLLARANYFTLIRDHQAAWRDLQEAYEIGYFGAMRLFLTDYHLLAAENLLAQLVDSDCTEYFAISDNEPVILTEADLHTHLKQHLQGAENLIAATDYQIKVPVLNRLYYQYNEQTLSTAAFKQAHSSDPQLQAGQVAIAREQALLAANSAVYACRDILQGVETGELAVTDQLTADFSAQLGELRAQIAIADDSYRRPILDELVTLSLKHHLT